MDITVAITTYNEGEYLDRLLDDISRQDLGTLEIEVVLLEAGSYDCLRAQKYLRDLAEKLVFLSSPGLSRTESFNKIFSVAKGSLIVRLDARSHIGPKYLAQVAKLSEETGAENVGGVMQPTGLTEEQKLIAEIMKHPFSFGGAKARVSVYRGCADSIYLGAFRKDRCKYGVEWFDSVNPKISEDSDLNYRLRKNGGRIFIDSSIVVEHYPRENLSRFFRLCYNYGVGRGLFLIKHRIFSAYRQIITPVCLLLAAALLAAGFYERFFHVVLLFLIFIYVVIVFYVSARISSKLKPFIKIASGFAGCHFFWTLGLLVSPFVHRRSIQKLHRSE